MMTTPLISAIVTTYKREFKTLTRSINSILNQTYNNIEIIVVDDNEVNSSYRCELEEKLPKMYPSIVYIKHAENYGAQVARNNGISASKGDYVAFLDDDDEWLPQKIELQMKAMKDDIGLVYCKGYSKYQDVGIKNYCTASNFKTEVKFSDLLYADYIGTTTQALISKKVLSAIGGFDINQPARQDYEMWIRISEKFRCVGVDEFLFIHYIHEGEQISKCSNKSLIGYRRIYKKYNNHYKKQYLSSCHILLTIAKLEIKNGLYINGFKNLILASSKIPKTLLYEYDSFRKILKEHKKRRENINE